MGINPFGNVVGGSYYGKRIIHYEPRTRCYVLEDGTKLDREEIDNIRSGMSGLREVKEPDKLKVTKDYLIRRRAERWNRRMVRIANKKWDKRQAVATEFAWKVGSTWAGLLTLIVSIYGLKWISHVILG